MAFEGLSDKLQNAFKKLSGRGKLTEADVKAAMREVRMALLEADVNYAIVKDFVKTVTERCVGAEILESLTPSQQVIKIVNEELTKLMGGVNAKLTHSPTAPTIYMMCGLQGAGKTTMCAKLGRMLKKENKRPLLVACDVYRPAAIRQLQIVGSQAGVEVYERGQGNPVQIAKEAVEHARYYGFNPVIIDTAGRLHIDEKLMQLPLELVDLFVFNEIEGAALSGTQNEEEMLDLLRKKWPHSRLLLTLGSRGCIYDDGQRRLRQGIYQAHAVDTTAAGDTFTGYFVAAMASASNGQASSI